jgi:hypothetical protein
MPSAVNTLAASCKAFSMAAPLVWNNLSLATRSALSIDVFKRKLKTELFFAAFNSVVS